jgi:hypothetical protein
MARELRARPTISPKLGPASERQGLIERYQQARQSAETPCTPLAIEDYVIQSMPDCSPTKWHLAHVSWFFQTFLLKPFAVRLPVPEFRLCVPVQFVLQRRWRQVPAAAARTDLTADCGRGLSLPCARG